MNSFQKLLDFLAKLHAAKISLRRVCAVGLVAMACARSGPKKPAVGDASGSWIVVSDTAPGISAMNDSARMGWHGREFRYGPEVAAVGTDTCRHPDYRVQVFDADSLFQLTFVILPAQLGFASKTTVTTTEVTCAGARWTAPGAFLIWVDAKHAYTVWNGVFFLLERQAAGASGPSAAADRLTPAHISYSAISGPVGRA